MHPSRNHAQEQVGPIVLNRASEHLLLGRDRRRAFYAAQSVDRSANTQIADALGDDVGILVRRTRSFLSVLDRHLGKTNADRANVASQDIAPIEGLARADGVVQALKVD